MYVLSVIGTRPEAIKMAPVIHAVARHPAMHSLVCATGQQKEMLAQMCQLFAIEPDYNLSLMQPDQSLADLTSTLISHLDKVLSASKPDWVLVQGDTTTCLAASLVAFYHKIPVGHIEAGLRSGNLYSPFPEQANRMLVGQLASRHFAPTTLAQTNLLKENIAAGNIEVTGNTVIDALLNIVERIDWQPEWQQLFRHAATPVRNGDKLIMITGHRRESFGEGFINICQALRTLAHRYPQWHFVYPVHLNPNVQTPVYEILQDCPNIYLLSPLDYMPFVYLMKQACLVITDSGGVQEEAPSLGKPVLVMRDNTERPEGIEAGTARLVGTSQSCIIEAVSELITQPQAYRAMAQATNPYGDGHAASRIVAALAGEKT